MGHERRDRAHNFVSITTSQILNGGFFFICVVLIVGIVDGCLRLDASLLEIYKMERIYSIANRYS